MPFFVNTQPKTVDWKQSLRYSPNLFIHPGDSMSNVFVFAARLILVETELLITIGILTALLLASLGWNYFFTREARKKFGLASVFTGTARTVIRWDWIGARADQCKPGMHTIILELDEPFAIMVGFNLHALGGWLNGWDIFGAGHSEPVGDGVHRYVMHTYLGNKPVQFQFVIDHPPDHIRLLHLNGIVDKYPASANAVFKPHWWQLLGWHA